ncbi:hypothetical protein KTR10_02295 [Candidatus Kaiserbacteria bacterium]|nr:hypothetical protein [Candidatus Kaiserbacteria bacterium]
MPIVIENNYGSVSLADLVALQNQGFSVLKSPHVGNQHPSNLVCAALKIPMEMVSFTQGVRDTNFHPHLLIKDGVGKPLYEAEIWTPFGVLSCGTSVTEFHQESLKTVFPQTDICTDIERMQSAPELAEIVLRETNQAVKQLWYRKTCAEGIVTSVKGVNHLSEQALETQVFQITNPTDGWIIPNRVHALFDFVWQSLSSGRDTIYHLSGPQMVGYIGGIKKSLCAGYDAIRKVIPDLPEVLIVRVVPVAPCRFVTLCSRAGALAAISDVVRWYEALPNEDRRYARDRFTEVVTAYPEFTQPITSGAYISQHDIASAGDLLLDSWMLETPLSRVGAIYQNLMKAQEICAHRKAA